MTASRAASQDLPRGAQQIGEASSASIDELETPMESPEIPAGAADPDEQLAQASHLTIPVPPVKVRAPRAADADAAVAALTHLQHAEGLFDDDALSSWLGFPVHGRHVRIKPERSVLMAWERTDGDRSAPDGADGPAQHGWTEVSLDTDKYAKTLARAERVGRQLTIHREDPVYLVSGSMWSDRMLGRELAEAQDALGPEVPWQVLRYNPGRRVVAGVQLEGAQHVVRVSAGEVAPQLAAADRWRRLGVPMEPMQPLGERGTAVISPRWGLGDLLQHPVGAAAETAGIVFGELHTRSSELEVQPDSVLIPEVAEAVHAIGLVAPWLGQRADMLAEMLSPQLEDLGETDELVELHGDLSPDQVLVSDLDGSRVRIIDLDRAGRGPAMRDVGSWVASCRAADHVELADAFLHGYREVAPIDEDSQAAWEAYAHLRAALDSFRRREANWPQQASRRMSMAERALQR
ncbi:phosphotransferase [Nesterenkonia xinjiangensis]|uniref:Aminoglycoside phosphotransferase domain-containing protein n=3 Tax=Nesterenkonia xinjiangensis TaxID=225327 RepID=A0A7Z0K985_9MICC|nr:hypothetical protein [Nesterenkonia xinjiangensis]